MFIISDKNNTKVTSRWVTESDDSNNDDKGSQQYTKSRREAATRAYLPAAAATQREILCSRQQRIQGQERQPKGGSTRVRCNATKKTGNDVYCITISLNKQIRSSFREEHYLLLKSIYVVTRKWTCHVSWHRHINLAAFTTSYIINKTQIGFPYVEIKFHTGDSVIIENVQTHILISSLRLM